MILIGFTGKMGCGKTTAIKFLEDFYDKNSVIVKFAQPLYDMQEFIYRRIQEVYQRPKDFTKDRKLLQWLGTEWGRDSISQDLWADIWRTSVQTAINNDSKAVVVCDDVRFDNEAVILRDLGGFLIKIESDKADGRINTNTGIIGHTSEQGVDEKYVDFLVTNNDTVTEFQTSLSRVYDMIDTIQKDKLFYNKEK